MKIALFICAIAASVATASGAEADTPNIRVRQLHGDEDHEHTNTSALCFSGETTVEVADEGPVRMEDLRIGSLVMTTDKQYQKVYASAHYDPKKEAEFLQFKTSESDNAMEVTADHLVYVQGQKYPVRASSIRVGDSLIHYEMPVQITDIKKITRTGVYAPLTPDGTLLVNGGYKASNYATPTGPDEEGYDPQFVEFQGSISSGISQQSMTHYLLAPLRLLCLGVAPQLCQNEVLLDQQGSPHYIQFMLDLANHARVHFSATAQAFMMMIFVIGLAPFALTEAMVGPALAPWLLALMGFLIFYKHKQNQAKAKTA